MKIRFQADADLNHVIVLAVLRRDPTVDFRAATVAGLAGLADEEVLALSARDGRLLVSHDHRTMPQHFARFTAENSSPGLLIVPQHLAPTSAAEDILLIWHATNPMEWTDRLYYLPV